MKHAPGSKGRRLGLFFVAMLIFGITTTLHGWSPLATYGLAAVFFLLVAILRHFIQQPVLAINGVMMNHAVSCRQA